MGNSRLKPYIAVLSGDQDSKVDVLANIGFSLLDFDDKVQAINVFLCESDIAISGDFSFTAFINFSTIVYGK